MSCWHCEELPEPSNADALEEAKSHLASIMTAYRQRIEIGLPVSEIHKAMLIAEARVADEQRKYDDERRKIALEHESRRPY